ncbi:MAG: hypothetical protein ACFHHU_00940 [Porticoccaceae bacterium]
MQDFLITNAEVVLLLPAASLVAVVFFLWHLRKLSLLARHDRYATGGDPANRSAEAQSDIKGN